MKRVLLLSIAVLFGMQTGLAMAAGNPDTGPGCGLGKLIWAEYKNQKEIAPQAFMATTNATGMNTFAISTGTSGCTNDGKFLSEHKVTMFASLNLDALSAEMAQGQGEHLASLASLMGVPAQQQPAFFAMTQERYVSLVEAGETSPVALVKALNDAIAGHPVFAQLSTR